MSWGTGPWGVTPWGGGAPPISVMTMVSAVPITTRTVLVALSAAALSGSPIRRGDALNPGTWQVQELDSLSGIVRTLNVLAVRPVTDRSFELATLQPLSNHLLNHRVTALGLLDSTNALIAEDVATMDFRGLVYPSPPILLGPRGAVDPVDTRNDVVPGAESGGGAPIIGSTGDYEVHGGQELFWKLVFRRLTSQRNGFFHLQGNTYGLGLRGKALLKVGNLPLFEQEVARQVQMEPECETAQVVVSLDRNNVCTIDITVKFRNGGSGRRSLVTRTT